MINLLIKEFINYPLTEKIINKMVLIFILLSSRLADKTIRG